MTESISRKTESIYAMENLASGAIVSIVAISVHLGSDLADGVPDALCLATVAGFYSDDDTQ